MTGVWTINGLNAITTYGLCLADNAFAEFTKLGKRKWEYTQNWMDENGTERYPLTSAKFETRVLNIPVVLRGDTVADFNLKILSFQSLITDGGYWEVYVEDLNRTWMLAYDDATNVTQITDPSTGQVIQQSFTLVLLDDWITPP